VTVKTGVSHRVGHEHMELTVSQRPSDARFPSTSWSRVVATADPGHPDADDALEELCAAYWFPVYALIRRRRHDPNTALDLTQDYFALLLEKPVLAGADRHTRRFRSFLLTDCVHIPGQRAIVRSRSNAAAAGPSCRSARARPKGVTASSRATTGPGLRRSPKCGPPSGYGPTSQEHTSSCVVPYGDKDILRKCGQDKDNPAPDPAVRADLRILAVDCVKADQAAWGRIPDGSDARARARAEVPGILSHRKADSDLAGVWEPETLAELPDAERKVWQALWTDADRMRERVGGKS
jgi:hypothetical protein